MRWVQLALIVAFLFLAAIPGGDDSPGNVIPKVKRARELVKELSPALGIDREVQVMGIPYHPLVFLVVPVNPRKDKFLLSMEVGFLQGLDDDELRAAVAHELGHVWIFRHHPFLQTERLANEIGERSVDRKNFERLYKKLWVYEGAAGVTMEQLLGPEPQPRTIPERQTNIRFGREP